MGTSQQKRNKIVHGPDKINNPKQLSAFSVFPDNDFIPSPQ
jgi:hypothetical protein